MSSPDPHSASLKTLKAPRQGALILACRKCQKKLRRSGPPQLARLKKSLRKLGKGTGLPALQVIDVPCFKLCPRGAVAVCTSRGLTTSPPTLTLLRTPEDLITLASLANRPPLIFPQPPRSPTPVTK